MGEVVITPVPYDGPRPSRDLQDRLVARFPRANHRSRQARPTLASPAIASAPGRVAPAVISGWGAASRRDWDLVATRYAPDVEIAWDTEFAALGVGTYHGHAGLREMSAAVEDAWEEWELVPAAMLDLGDRFLTLGTLRLPGNVSGLEMEPELAQLCTLKDALVAREQEFFGWDKGLRAAGLDPDEIRPLL